MWFTGLFFRLLLNGFHMSCCCGGCLGCSRSVFTTVMASGFGPFFCNRWDRTWVCTGGAGPPNNPCFWVQAISNGAGGQLRCLIGITESGGSYTATASFDEDVVGLPVLWQFYALYTATGLTQDDVCNQPIVLNRTSCTTPCGPPCTLWPATITLT